MSPFLSTNDVIELTGYKKQYRQAQWLREEGIPHRINGAGRPIVMLQDLYKNESNGQKRDAMPDLAALEALNG